MWNTAGVSGSGGSDCSCSHDISVTDIVNSNDELAPSMPLNAAHWHPVAAWLSMVVGGLLFCLVDLTVVATSAAELIAGSALSTTARSKSARCPHRFWGIHAHGAAPILSSCEYLLVARLRHADEHQECLLIGVDRMGSADSQSDEIGGILIEAA
jgi:hypothetical protein